MTNMTPGTAKLFKALVDLAPHWTDNPPVFISSAERGNLLDLKKKKLISTFEHEENSVVFALFTEAGSDLAEKLYGYRPCSHDPVPF